MENNDNVNVPAMELSSKTDTATTVDKSVNPEEQDCKESLGILKAEGGTDSKGPENHSFIKSDPDTPQISSNASSLQTPTADKEEARVKPENAADSVTADKDGDLNDQEGTDDAAMVPAEEPDAEPNPREAGFTSEIFKIEITGLPRKFGFAQLKKRLSSTLGLHPHKLKALPMKSYAFVCFTCEEERQKAIEAINGHVWKGRTLHAKKAQPSADPMKRKHGGSGDGSEPAAKQSRMEDSRPAAVRLRSSVEPLWDVPYEEQLKRKTNRVTDALKAVAAHGDVRAVFSKARKENEGMCCPLQPITPSPILEAYRNKSEFSIGRSEDGSETVVGFRFGSYKDGTDCVGSPTEIAIISPDTKAVVQSFEQYVRGSQYQHFNHRTHNGHWRQLTVRTSREGGGIMAVAEFVVNNTTEEQRQTEKTAIQKYFTEGEGKSAGVSTFLFRPCSTKTSNSTSEEPYELIYGEGHIFESMMGMKFRISPSAFFQVNTAASEVLYKLIADWCNASPTTTVLDICCGTGTIGLSMAKTVSKVIGIEMCKEAVEDAKVNAELNGITNVTYHCAKVEQVIQDIMRDLDTTDVVAILDPPRGGLHNSVLKALRSCQHLERIVYAACNPNGDGAKHNFLDLCRPASRKTKGQPFKIVRAMPLDMFPSTVHCEMLALFERDASAATAEDSSGD